MWHKNLFLLSFKFSNDANLNCKFRLCWQWDSIFVECNVHHPIYFLQEKKSFYLFGTFHLNTNSFKWEPGFEIDDVKESRQKSLQKSVRWNTFCNFVHVSDGVQNRFAVTSIVSVWKHIDFLVAFSGVPSHHLHSGNVDQCVMDSVVKSCHFTYCVFGIEIHSSSVRQKNSFLKFFLEILELIIESYDFQIYCRCNQQQKNTRKLHDSCSVFERLYFIFQAISFSAIRN